MKKIILLILTLAITSPINAQLVRVTFQVDMTYQNVSANGVHVAGDFQDTAGFGANWNPGSTQLFDSTNTNVYEITVMVPPGSYQYKFINGNAWGSDESVPLACGVGNFPYNRQAIIGTSDTTLPAICFGTCAACPQTQNITFQVDMRNQTIDSTGVYIAGSFQVAAGFPGNWDASATQLLDPNNDSIYSVTVTVPQGTYEYKFLNGNSFAGEEQVPSSCGVPNGLGGFNRQVAVSADTTIQAICFGSCTVCSAPPTPIYNVTFKLDMQTYTNAFGNAFVSGTFNGWNGSLDTLLDANGDTVYETTIQLAAGTYEYKFQLDNWTVPELFTGNEPCVISNSGNVNRIVTITGDTTLGEYCFGSCFDCPSSPPAFYEVVFSLDLNDYDTAFNQVFVSGTFNSWCGSCAELTDNNLDGIYTDTLLLPADTFQFKFNLDNWAISEIFSGNEICTDTAGGVANRSLIITGDTVIPAVCFNSCTQCPPRPQYNITLIADLKHQTADTSGVYIIGNFNQFDSTATQLQNIGDSLYSVQLTLDSGKTYHYRFLNGNMAEQAFGNCFSFAPNGFLGRSFTLNNNSDTLQTCFNECDTCLNVPAAQFYQVTFRVGMFGQAISNNGVHIAGNFQIAAGYTNNWDPSSTALTDADNDSIYEITLILPADTFEYKFINGNSWGSDEIVPAACGVGLTSLNRQIIINSDTTLMAVCFGSCSPCQQSIPPTQYAITFKVDMRLENTNSSGIYLTGDFVNWSADSLQMQNTTTGIYELTLLLDSGVNYQYKFLNGNSFAGEESVPAACGVPNGLGSFNREITAMNSTSLDTVCFSECGPCNLSITKQVSITFKVDMSQQSVDPTGVYIAGSFNNWSLTPLSLSSNQVYETTLLLDSNTIFQYKFVNGNNPGVYENVPSICGTPDGLGGFNRSIFTFGNVSLNEVCFSECAACTTAVPQTEVTFRVSMKNNPASNLGVHIAGNFNNYNVPQRRMMDTDLDSIFEISLMFDRGENLKFNFFNGISINNREKTDSLQLCGIDNGNGIFERNLIVPVNDTILPIVCFERCNNCVKQNDISVQEWIGLNTSVYYSNKQLIVQTNLPHELQYFTLYDVKGKIILQQTLVQEKFQVVDLNNNFSSGIYIYSIKTKAAYLRGRLYFAE